MLKGEDHCVNDLLDRDRYAVMTQHGAVECAVVNDDAVGLVDQVLQRLLPAGVVRVGAVPDRYRAAVFGQRDQQDLGFLGVAVRAVLDRLLAEGLGIKIQVHLVFPSALEKPGALYQQTRGVTGSRRASPERRMRRPEKG